MRIIKSITGTFFFVFTIAGLCSGSSLAQGYSQRADADKIRKDCPDLDEKSVQELANVKPGPGAHGYTYAHMFCVPLAEAARRTTLQFEKMGVIQQVTSEIIKNESTTYVNHWLRHNPDYKLVIEFTHNAEQTLAKYTDDPYFLGVNVPGENKQDKDRKSQEIIARLQQWDISIAMAGFDYKTGNFEVRLAADQETLIREKALQVGQIIPDWVAFIPPAPFPHNAPAAVSPERVKAFPRYKERHDMHFQTSMGVPDIPGILKLTNGCFEIETDTETVTVIWAKHFAPDLSDPDSVGVISRFSGKTIHTDEEIILSGLQPGPRNSVRIRNGKPELWAKVADDTDGPCPAPYIQIDSMTRKNDFETQIIEAKVKQLTMQGWLENDAKDEVKRQRKIGGEINNLIKNLKNTRKDIFAGGYGPHDGFAPPPSKMGYPPANLFIKGEIDKTELVPQHLIEYFRIQTVPRSLAEGESDVAFLKKKLGEDARVNFSPIDGKTRIEAVTDLKRLSDLLVEMGATWPSHYSYNIGANEFTPDYDMPDPSRSAEMRKSAAYKQIYDIAQKQQPQQNFHLLDRAVLKAMYFGFTAEEVMRLEAQGLGPITAQTDYKSDAYRQKDAIFSDLIILAEPLKHDSADDRGDGFRSTLTFKVLDVSKGTASVGQIVKVRMYSGEDKDGNHVKTKNEPHMLPGFNSGFSARKKWRLFLSKKGYEQRERLSMEFDNGEPVFMLSGRALPSK